MPTTEPDLFCDPFLERALPRVRKPLQLLGATFHFESNSPELLRLVDLACAGLPRHRLSDDLPRLRVGLHLSSGKRSHRRSEPPPLAMSSAAGLLGGATDSSDFVVIDPQQRRALVGVSAQMLRSPYHARYELIEFAVYTLAARVQRLVSLHGACVGRGRQGVLLMGPSGSGKSTVALHCLLKGFDFLSEDSVFVTPDTLLATGLANFVHVRSDSLRWIAGSREAARIRKSPVIRRRSGVSKFEVDLRRGDYRLAASALKVGAIVFLSAHNTDAAHSADGRPLLTSLSKAEMLARLKVTQAYAANQPEWRTFSRSVARIDAFELRRGRHPLDAVEALRELLDSRAE